MGRESAFGGSEVRFSCGSSEVEETSGSSPVVARADPSRMGNERAATTLSVRESEESVEENSLSFGAPSHSSTA